MPRGKIAESSSRLATVVPKELADKIKNLADKEKRSVSQFLAIHLEKEFGDKKDV
jgi:hypothetical protein